MFRKKFIAYMFSNSTKEIAAHSFDNEYFPVKTNDHIFSRDGLGCLSEKDLMDYLLKGCGDLLVTLRVRKIYSNNSVDHLYPKITKGYTIECIRDMRDPDTIDYIADLVPSNEWFTPYQLTEFDSYMTKIGADDALERFYSYIRFDRRGRLYINNTMLDKNHF